MKRPFAIISALLFSFGLMAESIPAGYYDGIQGKSDSILKSTLYQIVKGGDRYFYGTNEYHSSSNPPEWEQGDLKSIGTWFAFPLTDMHPDGVIWDMYSNCVRYYPKKRGDSGCSLNIEHCLPKSWWGTGVKTDTIYRDLFNLNPSDQRANSQKSNYAPGHVLKGDKFDNGSFRMDSKNKSQYGYICWEPAPEYRGDFARTYFYMVTAYEQQSWDAAYSDYVSNTSYLRFSPTIIQVLLDWHREDPVSDKEICRADRITDIQHNRNPFIDYPDLVEYIWGEKKGQAVDLASLSCTAGTGICPEPTTPAPAPQPYDTLINLPALTAALVNAVQGDITGSANTGIQSNGNASITMGKGTTDGDILFTGIQLTDTAVLAFRASPYNTAKSMQLDIYINNELFHSIEVTVAQETRNEIRYRFTVPQKTNTIRIVSEGGSTDKRACMQELYLLSPQSPSGVSNSSSRTYAPLKELRNGQVVIIRNTSVYSALGQQIQ